MIKKTFLTKSNTIVNGSKENFGLNPISMLHYGGVSSRFLIYFNVDEIKTFIDENGGDIDMFTHKLVMTNCGGVDVKHFNEKIVGFNGSDERNRATSFDVIAFELPYMWDAGNGFDSSLDFWLTGKACHSKNGSSWYNATNIQKWDDKGIYPIEKITEELKKFENGEKSIVVSKQHFDYGNENLSMDITSFINDIICNKKVNNGLCIAFSPFLECSDSTDVEYVGFFNNNTNTFFVPCVETINNTTIKDDRYNFILNRENNLLLFAQIGCELQNLDNIPTCTINGVEYPVKWLRKGVYGVNIRLSSKEYNSDEIINDIWGNLKYNGIEIDDVEMEFVTHSPNVFFNIGEIEDVLNEYTANVQGINDLEELNQDEKRMVKVYFKRNYTKSDYKIVDTAEYRIYTMDGKREVDVVKWDNIDIYSDFNCFYINADSFVPGKYIVDIKARIGNDIRVYKNTLKFIIKNNSTEEKY